MGAFVGIDLGTTYSVVAHISKHGTAEVLLDDNGRNLTPSIVDLNEGTPVVGWNAREKQELGDSGVYSFFKRQMGDPNAVFIHNGHTYTSIDLSHYVLRHLKLVAESRLGEPVTDAVITVPAYFKDPQRRATEEAANKAGLNVLRIINEPTAAAVAFGVRPTHRAANYLVYDLGGGTFDVSIVQIAPDELRVIGTEGDHELGGKNWDDRILAFLAERFETEFGISLVGDEINDLMVLSEETKKKLRELSSVSVTVQGGGRVGRYELTRTHFEDMTSDLLQRTADFCEQALTEQHMNWHDLEGVLLVGGSTRMPAVKRLIENVSGKPALAGVDPDEAVAKGAAIQAAMDYEKQSGTRLVLVGRKATSTDVIGSSMGMIALNEDGTKYINSIIIPKNKMIPCAETRPFTLKVRRSGENRLEVYMTQGEMPDPMSCVYLGKYVFTGIPPVQSKTVVIDITYAYNINGIVDVSAKERSTQSALTLTIEPLPPDVPDRFMLPPASETAQEHLTLYMAFDLSGSMTGDPLDKAKQAAIGFLGQCDLANTSLGIIEFSDSTLTTVHGVQDARRIENGIKSMSIGRTGYGNETDPFNELFNLLNRREGLRYGLVLTDGVWSNQKEAVRRAKRCHEAGIEIIAIGFGGADSDFLKRISSRDDLSFFTELGSLSDTFSTIAQELTEGGGTLEQERLKVRRGNLKLFK